MSSARSRRRSGSLRWWDAMATVILAILREASLAPGLTLPRRTVTTEWRRMARGGADSVAEWGRRLGVLPYRPERRSAEQWNSAYDAATLRYYGQLDELARYSIIVGYTAWFAAARPGLRPNILDVGCGTGLLRERLDGVGFAEYVGVDVSDAAIRAATARTYPRSRFLVGDVSSV